LMLFVLNDRWSCHLISVSSASASLIASLGAPRLHNY
jgi:hypothetical protein